MSERVVEILIYLMTVVGMTKSMSEARRLIKQGGVYINNVRVESIDRKITDADLASESMLVLRTGKKKYFLIKAK